MSEGEICAIVVASTMGVFMLCVAIRCIVLYRRNSCNHKWNDYEKVGGVRDKKHSFQTKTEPAQKDIR